MMLYNYLKLALKVLLRRKLFTFITLFGISFTLLVLMVATAMLDHVFAPRAPESRADRSLLVLALRMSGPRSSRTGGPGYGFLDRHVRTLPEVGKVSIASMPNRVVIYHDGRKLQHFLRRTDGEFWQIFDFDFVEGGPITIDDERNANPVAVINEATRDSLFGGTPAVGRAFEFDGKTFHVAGVVRNVPIARIIPFSDIWVPISTSKSDGYKREFVGDFMAVILARSRADFPAIKAEFASRLREAETPDPQQFDTLNGGAETLFEAVSRFLFSTSFSDSHPGRLRASLLAAMILFMLLPTVNLVNINLSRILERASEIGVRKAFGASSRALVGQFVMENVVLTLIGGLVGLALSGLVLQALNRSGLIPYAQFQLNLRIFAYGCLIALFFGVFSGVYPAWRMSRMHPVQALRGRSL